MTREKMLMRLMTYEPISSEWQSITDYADLLIELEKTLPGRDTRVLIEFGARMLRTTYPDLFRMVRVDADLPVIAPPSEAQERRPANA